jgi:hypothetical protein
MRYEPHYDVITKPGQVQIYEGIMLNTDNEVTYTLLRAAKYVKDLAKDEELPEVKRFLNMYQKADKTAQEIAAIQATVR